MINHTYKPLEKKDFLNEAEINFVNGGFCTTPPLPPIVIRFPPIRPIPGPGWPIDQPIFPSPIRPLD